MSDGAYSILVVGSHCTGKTINRDAIKEHFDCDHIIDDPDRFELVDLRPGRTLILSNQRYYLAEAQARAAFMFEPDEAYTVGAVKILLGDKWIEPIANFNQTKPSYVKPDISQGAAKVASPPVDLPALINALKYAQDAIVKMADCCDMEAVEEMGLDVQDCRDCVEFAIERAGGVL